MNDGSKDKAEWERLSAEVDEAKADCASAQKRITDVQSSPLLDQKLQESHEAIKRWCDTLEKLIKLTKGCF